MNDQPQSPNPLPLCQGVRGTLEAGRKGLVGYDQVSYRQAERSRYLEALGYRVLRFSKRTVLEDTATAAKEIAKY